MRFLDTIAAASGDGLYMNQSPPTQSVSLPFIAPTGLTATPNGQNEIDLSWTNTSQNNDEYLIERSTDGLNFTNVDLVQYADETEYQDTNQGNNLNPGTRYYYRVVAASSEYGTVSAPSNIASAATAPSISIAGDSSSNEGDTYTLTPSVQYAQGAPDPITGWALNWGDGNTQTITGDPASFTHVYTDAGNYTITATTADGSFTGTQNVGVAYVAGTMTVTNGGVAIDNGGTFAAIVVGDTITPVVTLQDPGGHHVVDWYINWGDGTAQTIAGTATGNAVPSTDTLNLLHTYKEFDVFPISISAETSNGFYEAGFVQRVQYNSDPDVSPPANVFNLSCTSMANTSGNADGTFDASLSANEISSAATSALIDWGDGGSPETIAVSAGAFTDTHHYVLPGAYPITVTATDGNTADDEVSRTSTYVQPYQTSYTPPAEQVVAYGQSLNLNMAYSGMPTGSISYGPVALVDWGDGTGEHSYNGSGDNINLTLDHTPAPGGDTVSIQYFDPWGAGVYGYGYERDNSFTLDVWGTKIEDGLNTDLLMAGDGTQNLEPVTVYFPHPDGEALDLTLTTSDAADDDLWPASGDTSGTPLLGGPAQTSSYSFSVGKDDPDYVQFWVAATNGNTTYDVLSYSISGDDDSSNSSTQFEDEKAAGDFGPTGATGASGNKASDAGLKIELANNPNTSQSNVDITDNAIPVNWLVGQYAQLTAQGIFPANIFTGQKAILSWDIPGNVLHDYTADANTAKQTPLNTETGLASDKVQFFWVTTAGGQPDVDKITFTEDLGNGQLSAYTTFSVYSPTATITPTQDGSSELQFRSNPNRGGRLLPYVQLVGGNGMNGIEITSAVALPQGTNFNPGEWEFVQKVVPGRTWHRLVINNGAPVAGAPVTFSLNGAGDVLDSAYPYYNVKNLQQGKAAIFATGNESQTAIDSPGEPLAGSHDKEINDVYNMFVMFKPPGTGSKWVPLKSVQWKWIVALQVMRRPRTNGPNDTGYDIISSKPTDPQIVDVTAEPEWTHNIKDGKDQ